MIIIFYKIIHEIYIIVMKVTVVIFYQTKQKKYIIN